jgi:hypothetical protein
VLKCLLFQDFHFDNSHDSHVKNQLHFATLDIVMINPLLVAMILLKMALNTKNQSINQSIVKADIHGRVLKMKTSR